MTQKKVLLVSYSFPPSNAPAAQRAFYFAKYLPENNIELSVLTTSKNISSLGYGNSMNTEGMKIIDTDSVIHSTNSTTVHQGITSKNIIKNNWLKKILVQLMIPDRGIIWLPKALKFGSDFLRTTHVDCIYATAPSFTNFLIAYILSKRFNKKLICDFRDFYVVNGLFKRIFPLNLLDKLLEKTIVKTSAHLIFISKNMKAVYGNKYPFIKNKSTLIYNGFDDKDYQNIQAAEVSNDKLKIFFAGSFYFDSKHPRDIFLLLDSLEDLVKNKSIQKEKIEITIAAFIHTDLMMKIEKHFMFNSIKLLGIIKRENVLLEMQQANLLWHILGNSKQDVGAIPIKTFEYIASEKPVLFFVPKGAELSEIATEFNLGYICYLEKEFKEFNQQQILKAFRDIVIEKRKYQSDKSRFKNFRRDYQAQQLAEIIQNLN